MLKVTRNIKVYKLKCSFCGKVYPDTKDFRKVLREHEKWHILTNNLVVGSTVKYKHSLGDGYYEDIDGKIIKIDTKELEVLLERASEEREWTSIDSLLI